MPEIIRRIVVIPEARRDIIFHMIAEDLASAREEKCILIVDDEPDLCDAMGFGFQKLGYKVLVAANGNEAWDIYRKNKIDLVISDVRMPECDGVELLERIRGQDATVPPVILVTGFADITEDIAISKGAKGVIAKPFDLDEFEEAALRALGDRSDSAE